MNRIIISFLFIVFLTNSVKGQTFLSNNITTSVTLSSDFLNAEIWESLDLIITSNQNVAISGQFFSNTSVAIIPTGIKSIVIKPIEENFFYKGDGSTPTPPTTVVRPVQGGGGTLPLVTLYPNPVNRDLNFSTEKPVVGYSIYDAMGNLNMTQNIAPTYSHSINVTNLTSGNYMLRLYFSDSYITVHFIKH